MAKWIRRRFPEPKIVGSSPIWDGRAFCNRFLRASPFGPSSFLLSHSSSLAVEHRSYEPGVAGSIPAWSIVQRL